MPLLSVRHLRTYVYAAGGPLKAVDGVSFDLEPREVLGLVGESGAGKTLTGRSILRLLPENAGIVGGQILFKGQDLAVMSENSLRLIRGREITAVLQDPLSSLNPAFRISEQMIDIQMLHLGLAEQEAEQRAGELLEFVGIGNADAVLNQYPHQISGGMRQRVMIAIAFSCRPSLVIADEPTSALDVITQIQIAALMKGIQTAQGTAVLFITHNLGLASKVCDRIAVMYAGRLVELAATEAIFKQPKHPYTEALLRIIPRYDRVPDQIYSIPGMVPDLSALPSGCHYHPRCHMRFDKCPVVDPRLAEVENNHTVACLLYPGCEGTRP